MATKKIVQELITLWKYKVDASELRQTSKAILGLKTSMNNVRSSSVKFARFEHNRINKLRDSWRGLANQVGVYRRNIERPVRSGLGVGRGAGTGKAGLAQSGAFLAGRLTGSTALTSALLGGSGLAGAFGIGAAIKAAGQRQQQKAAFTGLLGGGEEGKGKATDMLDRLNAFAKETPFQITDLRDLARRSLGGGMGMDEVIPQLRMLGDVTSGNIDHLKRMLANMIEIRNTQRASLRDIRQFGNVGIPIYEALEKVTGLSGEALAKQISKAKIGFKEITDALKYLTGKGGKFYNAMKLQMDTLLGQVSNLGDALIDMGEKIGQPLLAPATEMVKGIKRVIEAITPPLKNLGMGIGGVIEGLKKLWDTGVFGYTVLGGLAIYLGKVTSAFKLLNKSTMGLTFLFLWLEDLGVYLQGGDSLIGLIVDSIEKINWDKLDIGDVILGGWISLVEKIQEFGDWLSNTTVGKATIKFFETMGNPLGITKGSLGALDSINGGTILPASNSNYNRNDQIFNNKTSIYMKPSDQLPTILEQVNDSIFAQERKARRLFEA